jgi:hypothetical protein
VQALYNSVNQASLTQSILRLPRTSRRLCLSFIFLSSGTLRTVIVVVARFLPTGTSINTQRRRGPFSIHIGHMVHLVHGRCSDSFGPLRRRRRGIRQRQMRSRHVLMLLMLLGLGLLVRIVGRVCSKCGVQRHGRWWMHRVMILLVATRRHYFALILLRGRQK